MLGGDLVHGGREIERDIAMHVAVDEDLAGELARAGAELEDAELGARRQGGAERGKEARPIRTLDTRVLDPDARGRRVAKVDPDRQVVVVACHVISVLQQSWVNAPHRRYTPRMEHAFSFFADTYDTERIKNLSV